MYNHINLLALYTQTSLTVTSRDTNDFSIIARIFHSEHNYTNPYLVKALLTDTLLSLYYVVTDYSAPGWLLQRSSFKGG